MKIPLSPPQPPTPASSREQLPRLWPALPSPQQQQLAQRLAELLQRHHRARQNTPPRGTEHDNG